MMSHKTRHRRRAAKAGGGGGVPDTERQEAKGMGWIPSAQRFFNGVALRQMFYQSAPTVPSHGSS